MRDRLGSLSTLQQKVHLILQLESICCAKSYFNELQKQSSLDRATSQDPRRSAKGWIGLSVPPLQDPTVWAAWPYTRPAKDHAGHAPFPKGRWSRQGLLDSNPQSLQQRGDWAVCLPCACTVFKQGEIGCLSSLRHNGDKLALIKESPRHGQASLQTW